ncbi:MAG: ABC transporter permease [Actinomycetota bacterium]|nr:ABC transporter permease [Actinomycetota bacterium]
MRLFLHQLRAEQLQFWRSREAAIFIFVFPMLLFVLLGSVYSGEISGHPASEVLLAGMLGYGAANTAFAGLGVILVVRREGGILKRIRSTPLPAATYLAATLTSILAVFVLQTVLLFALGRVLYGTHLPGRIGSLALVLVFGAAVFAALGLAATALIRSAEGSSAVLNTVLLPMAFLSGSFGPRERYPEVLRAIGDVLPLRYFLELVNGVYLDDRGPWHNGTAAGVLAAWGVAGLVVAARRFGWEPRSA